MQPCVLVRHGESEYNVQGRINGDPAVAVSLSAHGREEARVLGVYLAQVPLTVCLHTRFPRTLQTARIALGGRERELPLECDPLLDDIRVGDLEGRSAEEYHSWKSAHPRDAPLPGGESIRDAACRYARALRSLAERPEALVLVACHELPLRFAVNAALGSQNMVGPEHDIANATPYLFEPEGLRRAAQCIQAQADGPWGCAHPAAAQA